MEIDILEGRLIIKQVILRNFKSYAGEKIIGPFHKSLTSVVGPNGSGKSNLLESLLFAFGKRARKMRLKKLSELIHHSHTHPNLKKASVEVHFLNIIDTDTGFTEVPGSSLILTRTVHKNSTSDYKLDHRPSSYEEVTSTLKRRGIDLEHNRFLILQGEVEQIAMMKPRAPPGDENKSGLLEYLEEIIGTDQYVPNIEVAEKELEALGDEVAAKKMRFEEAKKTLDLLEAPLKEALGYIELEKECVEFRVLKCRLEHFARVRLLGEVTGGIREQDENLVELEGRFNKKRKENEEVINEYEMKAKQGKDVKKALDRLLKELKELIEYDTRQTQDVKQTKTALQQNEKDKETNAKRSQELRRDIEELEKKVPVSLEHLEAVKSQRMEKEQEFHDKSLEVQQITEALHKQKTAIDQEIKPIKRELTQAKGERDSYLQKISLLHQDILSGDTEKQVIHTTLDEISKKLQEKHKEHEESKAAYNSQCLDLQASQSKINEITREIDINERIFREHQQKINTFESEEKKMFENKGRLSEILRAKMEKRLTGVHGRLGDLGEINAIYDTAVSSAFGQLDSLVVETVREANEVFAFARERNLGKINIICIEKTRIDLRKMNNFQGTDHKAVRLFDQITFAEDRFKMPFYSVFQDTLFTDTMEDARRLAFGERRQKVVTRDGNIINPSGEMRGFAQPIRGKMKLLGSRSVSVSTNVDVNISEVKREAKRIADILENLKKSKIKIESAVVQSQINDRQCIQRLKVLEYEIISINDRVRPLKERLVTLNNRSVDEMQSETQRFQTVVENSERSMAKLAQILEQKSKQTSEIESRIDEVAGTEFKSLKQAYKKLQEDEERLEKDCMKSEATLVQRKKDIEKYNNKLHEIELEREGLTSRYDELMKIRTDTKTKAEALATETKQKQEDLEVQEKLMKSLQEQQDFLRKEFDEITRSRDEVKAKKKELLSQLNGLEAEIQRWQTKTEGALKNYSDLIQDCSELTRGIEVEQLDFVNPEHQAKRARTTDRVQLRKDVEWEPTTEELEQMCTKIAAIEAIQETIEKELAVNRPNLKVIDEYKDRLGEKTLKEETLNEAKLQENELKTLYTDYKNKRLTEFTRGFREISNKLREMYQLLTRGGDAELELADSTDPFSEGIVFTVRPPSKSWKKMANLSGGEKTLSSLALVFALHHYKPNSLYVMDEVDAALDFQNVSVIAQYIKSQTKNAQFIVVSLRYQMFEVADQLVGIYKINDVSQSLCICPYSLAEIQIPNRIISQTLDNIAAKEN